MYVRGFSRERPRVKSLQLPTVVITPSHFICGLFDNWTLRFTVLTSFLSNRKV